MLQPSYTRQFEKDLKKMQKRGKSVAKLKQVMGDLVAEKKLDVHYRDHKLIGNYLNRRECHIEPDWLLIYQSKTESILFERTGSHADLF
ncbi:MAG: mRNA interferase YafQ [Phenylobacterium sp.]|jgi:mRNA interferase YafQ